MSLENRSSEPLKNQHNIRDLSAVENIYYSIEKFLTE